MVLSLLIFGGLISCVINSAKFRKELITASIEKYLAISFSQNEYNSLLNT
jgi:hypothetical protein